jgi:hypothetical protein
MKRLMLLPLVLLFTVSALSQTRQPGDITSTYDKFKDLTTVSLFFMPVPTEHYERLVLGVYFIYPGTTLKQNVSQVTLLLRSNSEQWKFLHEDERELIILADDERIPLGSIERIQGEITSGGVAEFLGINLAASTFEKIVKAKKVEAQLGTVEFHLTSGNLKFLQDFAAKMNP